jgi:hypothetical protein
VFTFGVVWSGRIASEPSGGRSVHQGPSATDVGRKLQTPMTRRTAEITPKRIDDAYPHQIEIPSPLAGQHDHHQFCRSQAL